MKNNFYYLLITLYILSSQVFAQNTNAFRSNYDLALFDLPANAVEALAPNNYLFAGTNLNFIPVFGTVTQVNATGALVWSKRYYDGSFGFEVSDIKKDDALSQYYLCGGSASNAGVIFTIDAAGNLVWSRRFSIAEADGAFFNRVLKTSDGGYVAVGYVTGYDPDGAGPEIKFSPITYTDNNGETKTERIASPLIAKFDASGNHVWHKVFRYYINAAKDPASHRIYNSARFYDVVEVADGYMAVGNYKVNQFRSRTNSDGDDATPTDALILKTDFNGNITYHKQIDNPSTSTSQTSKSLTAISKTSAGAPIAGGSDNSRALIQKYAATGGWSYTFSRLFTYSSGFFGTDPADISQIYEVQGSTDIVTMAMYIRPLSFGFHNALHRMNATASANVWAKRYDYSLFTILPKGSQTSDGGHIMTSMTLGGTNYDYHLLKTDSDGNTPLDDCPPTSFTPSPAAGPTTFADPYYNVWSGTPGPNALTLLVTNLTPTANFVCVHEDCAAPEITLQPVDRTVCSSGSTSLLVAAASGPYQWQYNNGGTWVNVSNGIPSGFSYTGNTSDNLQITTLNATQGQYQFRVEVGDTDCSDFSEVATVTVPGANRLVPTGPQCSGTQLNFDAFPTTGATYMWTVSAPLGTSASPTNGSSSTFSFTPENNSGSTQTFTIEVEITHNGVTCNRIFTEDIFTTYSSSIDTVLCSGETFVVNGNTYGNGVLSGTENMTSVNGCDSVITVSVTELPSASSTENISDCDSVVVNGVAYYTSTSFNEVFPSASTNGCDSTVTYNITVNFTSVTTSAGTSCNPADVGEFISDLTNQFGCDSVHTLTVTLLDSDSTFATATSCNPADVGEFISNLTNQLGCDSVHTLTVTLLDSDSTFATATSCNPADVGEFISDLTNQFGCDSVHTLTVTLLDSDSTFATATSCNPADVGEFISDLTNQFGCDSVHTLTVTLLDSDSTFATATSCNPADVGEFISDLTNQFGCDSVHTLTVTLLDSDSTFATATSCNPSDVGEFVSNLTNQLGCDSVHTLTVTLLNGDSTFTTATSCNPSDLGEFVSNLTNQLGCDSVHTLTVTLLDGDSTFATATSCNPSDLGEFVSNLTNQFGCDSVHTLTVTLLDSDSTFATATSCNPADVGEFISDLTNQFGCDSVHTLTVTLLDSDSTFATATSCNPADVGEFISDLTNQFGCDSVHTLTVTLLDSDSTFATATSCNPADVGEFISDLTNQFGCDSVHTLTVTLLDSDSTFATATSCNPADVGEFISDLTNQFGCDSVHTLTVTLLDSDSTFATATSCNPADVGEFISDLTNQFGCDSVHTLTVTILPSDSTSENQTTCDPLQEGRIHVTFTNQNGCDSVHTTVTTLLPTSNTSEEVFTCEPSEVGLNVINLQNQFGCDSTHTITITLLPSSSSTATVTTCNPSEVGMETFVFVNQFGCDSVHTVTTVIGDEILPQFNPLGSVCEGANPPILPNVSNNGITGVWTPEPTTELAGNQVFTFVPDAGQCATSTTLDFVVNAAPEVNLEDTTINRGTRILLSSEVLGNAPFSYNWTSEAGLSCTGCISPMTGPNETSLYYLTVTDANGCVGSDSMFVFVDTYGLFIPDAFTPNGDGVNDIHYVYGGPLSSMKIMIFNRWGEKIFESTDQNFGWDGTYMGKLVNPGVYVYYFEGELTDGGDVSQKGSITVIR
jgi:gliding motility-associated-like protein